MADIERRIQEEGTPRQEIPLQQPRLTEQADPQEELDNGANLERIMDETGVSYEERPLIRAIARLPQEPKRSLDFRENLLTKIKAHGEIIWSQRQEEWNQQHRNSSHTPEQDLPPQGK
jgi:hypothetical protein